MSAQNTDFTIIVYGSCLAGYLASASLSRALPPYYKIVHIAPNDVPNCTALYGGITGPSGYELFRNAGLEEPLLFTQSNTSFSFGTHFRDWRNGTTDWVQCFSQPFNGYQDSALDHLVSFHNDRLEGHLIAAQAALQGKFAHPPEDKNNPLSRAEYGYHFSPQNIADLLKRLPADGRSERIEGEIKNIDSVGDNIASISLTDGRTLSGDLFIDCTGTERAIINALSSKFSTERKLTAKAFSTQSAELGPPCRRLTASETGYELSIPLMAQTDVLQVSHEHAATDQSLTAVHPGTKEFSFSTGALDAAWLGNCIALGNAAFVFEPLGTAPMTLLHRQLSKLAELMPSSSDMNMERKEYNRLYREDVVNAGDFYRALFVADDLPKSSYWKEAQELPCSERLERRLEQFESRGILVQYDYEPFNTEDWAILHYGMGRRPQRHDVRLKCVQGADPYLAASRQTIQNLLAKMPPHHQYVVRFKAYLEKNRHDR